jgi:type I restriction enzyme S subunit
LLALRPGPDVSAEFLFYRLISADFIDLVNSTTFGSKMPRADWEQIGSIRVAFPSLDEQARIVSILDLKTTEIDRSLERKQRLIELLDEKRAALISRAVTQGLDLGVPMKDTGVPWLGRCVPAHWEPIAIKFGLRALVDTEHKTAPFYPDGTFLVVRTSNIRRGALVLEDARYTDEEGFKSWTARGRPQAGDIMFTREAPAGEACIVPEGVDLCLGQRVVLMRLDPNALTSRFTLWALYGGISAEFVKLLSQGTTVAHFNMEDIKNIPLLRPPLEEQVRIASHIDREVVKLDQICAAARQSIELMIERRSVLITAAVTGQLDIRAHEKKMEALV